MEPPGDIVLIAPPSKLRVNPPKEPILVELPIAILECALRALAEPTRRLEESTNARTNFTCFFVNILHLDSILSSYAVVINCYDKPLSLCESRLGGMTYRKKEN